MATERQLPAWFMQRMQGSMYYFDMSDQFMRATHMHFVHKCGERAELNVYSGERRIGRWVKRRNIAVMLALGIPLQQPQLQLPLQEQTSTGSVK